MQRIEPPTVREGQAVTPGLFAAMRRAARACRLIPGEGVRLQWTPRGTIINASRGHTFGHPWRVSLIGFEAAQIAPGTINKVPASIDGEPLDGGKEGKAPPVLEFGKPKLDADGRGWIAAEITCDPAERWIVKTVEIVQVADCDTEDGSPLPGLPNATGGSLPLSGGRARHPLAMLRSRKNGRLDVYQITFFDLSHRVALAKDQTAAARHFFYT